MFLKLGKDSESEEAALLQWAFQHAEINPDSTVLDLSCSYGRTVQTWLKKCPYGKAAGLAPSEKERKAAQKLNHTAVSENRCVIVSGSASHLPFMHEMFDLVSMSDEQLHKNNISACLSEACRVLKPGGQILICSRGVSDELDPQTVHDQLMQAGFRKIRGFRHHGSTWFCMLALKMENPAGQE